MKRWGLLLLLFACRSMQASNLDNLKAVAQCTVCCCLVLDRLCYASDKLSLKDH